MKRLLLIVFCLLAADVSAQVQTFARIDFTPDPVSIAATGGVATVTITPKTGNLVIDCQDTDTCAVTLGETGIKNGTILNVFNASANVVTFADVPNVQELQSSVSLAQYASLSCSYLTDRWVCGAAGSGGAPTSAQYIVSSTDATLSAERVLTDTATVTWDAATAAQMKANVPSNAITNTLIRDSAATSIIGRSANSTGDPADIAAGAVGQVLRQGAGPTLGFGAVDVADSDAITGILPVANGGATVTDDSVSVGNGSVPQSKTIPTCTDTGGNHLNYDPSTNTFSCGTSGGTSSGNGGGAVVFLKEQVASSSATLDFTNFVSAAYEEYVFELLNIIPATDNVELHLRVSTDDGATYDSGANYSQAGVYGSTSNTEGSTGGATGQTRILLADTIDNASTGSVNGSFKLFNPASTATHKAVQGSLNFIANSGVRYFYHNGGWYVSTSAVNGVRFLMSSGNIASGTIRVYGIAKANTLSGNNLIAVKTYAPGTNAVYSTTSATYAALDTTNLRTTFTAPASGSVLVRLTAYADYNSGGNEYGWALLSGASIVSGSGGMANRIATAGTGTTVSVSFVISGLTGGTSYTWDWAHAENATGTGRTLCGPGATNTTYQTDNAGMCVMEIWDAATNSAFPSGGAYLHYQDQKSSGTNGGTCTSGAWRTRDINTEVSDTGNLGTLASNQITLVAGTYQVRAHAPAVVVNGHQTRLWNATDSTLILPGTSEQASTSAGIQSRSHVSGEFTIAAGKAIELQHQCGTTRSTDGFGAANSFGTELYSNIEFWRIR